MPRFSSSLPAGIVAAIMALAVGVPASRAEPRETPAPRPEAAFKGVLDEKPAALARAAPVAPPRTKSARPADGRPPPTRKGGQPPARERTKADADRGSAARAEGTKKAAAPACRCAVRKCPAHERVRAEKRLFFLAAAVSMGGFYSKTTRWIRSDANLRIEFSVRLHPQVHVQAAFINSLERYMHLFRVGAKWFPFRKGLYGRLSFEMGLTGAGVQPGFSGAVGFAWWFSFPFGLYAEFEPSGYVTAPHVFQLQVAGGVFAYF